MRLFLATVPCGIYGTPISRSSFQVSSFKVVSICKRYVSKSSAVASAGIKNGEVILLGTHISPYEKGNIFNRDPLRERKLLMHKYEIRRLIGKIKEDGYSLIPLKVYLKGSVVKVELALARGKKTYDTRDSIAEKEAKRRIDRKIKDYTR